MFLAFGLQFSRDFLFSLLLFSVSGRGRAHLCTVSSIELQPSDRKVPVVHFKPDPGQDFFQEGGYSPFCILFTFIFSFDERKRFFMLTFLHWGGD